MTGKITEKTEKIRVKLAAVAKDEAFYLPLWVYHHFTFGFDTIEIWVNGTSDNSLAVLEKLRTLYGARLVVLEADAELQDCLARGRGFQPHAYHRIYQNALTQDFSHLLFLDIDEYWVSSNFQHSIQDFLRSMPDFDSCLFPWLLDVPDHQRSPDDFPFQALGHYQKSSHVKSLLNLKAAVRQVGIHKHIIGETQGRQARHLLPDGNFVGQRPEDGGKEPSLLGAGRMRVDAAFICHQLYRSQAEYLARLLNGRQAVGGREWLKSNRYGYVPKWGGDFVLDWSVDASRLADYRRGYDALRSTLASELAVARQFVLARKDELLAGLRHDGFLQSVYSAALKGVDETTLPRQLPPFAMQAQIQAMGFDEERACCWFTFEIVTREVDYELFLTEGYSRTRLEASIRALDAGEEETAQPRRFRAEVDVHALMHLYNPRQPPFCLVACAGENWVLLAQQGFAALAPAAFQRVRALKLARSSSGDTVSKRGLPVSKRLGSGWPVWKKRMMAWVK